MERERKRPVFSQSSGARWQRIRRVAMGAGIATSVLLFGLVAAVLTPPSLPKLSLRESTPIPPANLPELNGTRALRLKAVARERLYEALHVAPAVPARRPSRLQLTPTELPQQATASHVAPVTVGF